MKRVGNTTARELELHGQVVPPGGTVKIAGGAAVPPGFCEHPITRKPPRKRVPSGRSRRAKAKADARAAALAAESGPAAEPATEPELEVKSEPELKTEPEDDEGEDGN